jgi:hypothetical protein
MKNSSNTDEEAIPVAEGSTAVFYLRPLSSPGWGLRPWPSGEGSIPPAVQW